jgi:hypothetical protein
MAAAATLAFAAQAHAAPTSFYFDCNGEAPLTNLANDALSWSATAPATAAQDGGGCFTGDTYIQGTDPGNYVYDVVAGGQYGGEVRKLDLTLFGVRSSPLGGALGIPTNARIRIEVDGDLVFDEARKVPAEASGALPTGVKASFSLTGLEISASASPKDFRISVSNLWTDDPTVFGRGASDFASGVKLYGFDDLTPEEQCEVDVSFCPEEEE